MDVLDSYLVADCNPNPVFQISIDFFESQYYNKAAEKFLNQFNEKEAQAWPQKIREVIYLNLPEFEFETATKVFLFKVSPVKNEGFVFFYGTEITSIRKSAIEAKAQLEAQKNLYTQILNSLPINIFLKDDQQRFVFVNKQTASTLDLEVSDFLGKTDIDVHPESVASKLQLDDELVWEKQELVIKEEEIIRDGKRFFLLSGKNIINHSIENKKMLLGFSIDMTEKKQHEETLKYQQGLIQEVIDGSPNLIFVKDYTGHFIMVNQAVADLFGGTKEGVINQNNSAIHDRPTEVEAYSKVDREVISTGKTIEVEEPFTLPNGETKWFYTIKKPLVRPDGEIQALAISIDITERKKFEYELRQAKEKAEAASRAKTDFLSNMSHEIRTPLNAILGMANLLQDSIKKDKNIAYLDAIRKSGDNLLKIINELLDFAKIDSGKLELEKASININDIVQNVTTSLKPKAEEKELLLIEDFDDAIYPFLEGDALRLNQVLMNLMSNALKFTEEGTIKLSTKLLTEDEFSQTIYFCAEDTGIGVSKDMQSKIFDSFTQEDSSVSRKYGGTGLGLPICKKLVELQGGSLSLSSEKGKGSKFCFELTFRKLTPSKTKSYEEHKTFESLKGKRILIAEDNQFNQFLVTSILDAWQVEYEVANNGQEVLERYEANEFDAILMDIQMPILDGTQATQKIRNSFHQQKSKIPILALTANALKGNKEKYLKAGMNDYITKPFQAEDLGMKIENLLKN